MKLCISLINDFRSLITSRYSIPYWTSFFSCLLCFLPIFAGWKFYYGNYNKNSSPISYALDSANFEYSLVAGMAVAMPIILEILIDKLHASKRITESYISRDGFIVLLVPIVLLFFFVLKYETISFVPVIFHSQRIFYFHTFSYYMNAYGSAVWTEGRTITMATLITIGEIAECYGAFYGDSYGLIFIVSSTLRALSSIIFLFLSFIWITSQINNIVILKRKFTRLDFCCNVYLFSFFFALVGVWSIGFALGLNPWYEVRYVLDAIYFSFIVQ